MILKIKPDIIYAAGDLTDPHGTHRSCLVSVVSAITEIEAMESEKWINDCSVLLYRGAW